MAPPSPFLQAEYIEKNPMEVTHASTRVKLMNESVTKSTKAAISYLNEIWADEELKKSGALVQLAILSYNAGYNDEPYVKEEDEQYSAGIQKTFKKDEYRWGLLFMETTLCDSRKTVVNKSRGKMWWCIGQSNTALWL